MGGVRWQRQTRWTSLCLFPVPSLLRLFFFHFSSPSVSPHVCHFEAAIGIASMHGARAGACAARPSDGSKSAPVRDGCPDVTVRFESTLLRFGSLPFALIFLSSACFSWSISFHVHFRLSDGSGTRVVVQWAVTVVE